MSVIENLDSVSISHIELMKNHEEKPKYNHFSNANARSISQAHNKPSSFGISRQHVNQT